MLPVDFKPYLIRSFYEYLTDKSLTPYLHVFVNEFTQVPSEYVVDQAITLNISMHACPNILIENDHISFQARFSGQLREINIPIGHVLAIYARENTDLVLTFPLDEKQATSTSKTDQEPETQNIKESKEELSSHLKIIKKKDKK